MPAPRPPKTVGPLVLVPSGKEDRTPSGQAKAPRLLLRLAIGRDGLGLETAEPARLGFAEVTELTQALPGVRFPLDVSGGVARFRHRRGQLARMAVEVPVRNFERFVAPLWRGLLGPRDPEVWVAIGRVGATVGLLDDVDPRAPRLLAFDWLFDLDDDAIGIIVTNARGGELSAPPLALALRATQAVLGSWGRKDGSRFVVANVTQRIARALLPEAGARVPSSEGMRWTGWVGHAERLIAHAAHEGRTAEPTTAAVLAREVARIAEEGDNALYEDNLERARSLYVAALERAPRHPELGIRIAEIDRFVGGRSEAALATLAETNRSAVVPTGPLEPELLLASGRTEAATAAFARVGEMEEVPFLGAALLERAAALVADPNDALVWLDRAAARAPASSRIRWQRAERRLSLGRIDEARADVEHLEALARSPRQKHGVYVRAGAMYRRVGLRDAAATAFEQALRFSPDDPRALAGLGLALAHEGRAARGVALLERAIDLARDADPRKLPPSDTVLELAQVLVDKLGDRPAAIARLRSIAPAAPEAVRAYALEGRWRSELGDFAGASLAYARFCDRVASMGSATPDSEAYVLLAFVREAARFEEGRADPASAQRHVLAGLRLRPGDAALLSDSRRLGRLLLPEGPEELRREPPPAAPGVHGAKARPEGAVVAPLPGRDSPAKPLRSFEDDDAPSDPQAEARVEELTRRLQLDPNDDDVVEELSELLTKLERGHELLALLSARLEEASPERRVELVPRQRRVLERLADDAEKAGRTAEAELFRISLEALSQS